MKSRLFVALAFLSPALALAESGAFPIQHVRTAAYEIAVVGDLEGMGHRLQSFIDGSGVFRRNPDGTVDLLDGKAFVFMGDAIGRGSEDHEIQEFMIKMKERYPDRVTLILGNRDIWALGMGVDTSEEALRRPDPFFEMWLQFKKLDPAKDDTREMRLRFLLEVRVEAEPAAVRRAELKAQGKAGTDEEVLDSFLVDIKPGGTSARYLELAQAAFIDESTRTLFVHGAVTESVLGRVPGSATKHRDIREWIRALNERVQALALQATRGDPQAIDELMKYSNDFDGSVVANRFDDSRGSPLVADEKTRSVLREQGLLRQAVGHTPHGEFPVIGRMPYPDGGPAFQILMTDASYNRSGSTPRIILKGDHLSTSLELFDKNGQSLVHVQADLAYDQDTIVGRHTTDGGIIIGTAGPDDYVVYRIGPGFRRNYSSDTEAALKPRLLVSYKAASAGCREAFRTFKSP